MGPEREGKPSKKYMFLAMDAKTNEEYTYEDVGNIEVAEANVAEGNTISVLYNERCSDVVNFISDTGSTEHIVNTLDPLVDIKNFNNEIAIESANAAESTSLKATYKAELERLQKVVEELKKCLLQKKEHRKEFRANHPAVILDQNADFESWKKICFNELQSMNLMWLVDEGDPKPDLLDTNSKKKLCM